MESLIRKVWFGSWRLCLDLTLLLLCHTLYTLIYNCVYNCVLSARPAASDPRDAARDAQPAAACRRPRAPLTRCSPSRQMSRANAHCS